MKTYFSEVLPALLAMGVMGIAGFILALLYETLRSYLKMAFAHTKTARAATPAPSAAEHPPQVVEEYPAPEAEEAIHEDPGLDEDSSTFEGVFAEPTEATVLVQSDLEPENPGETEQTKLALDQSPPKNTETEDAQRRRVREKQTERRKRKAEKRSGDTKDETRQRARKERETAPEDVRKRRQQNRQKNR